jgi:hypothetical protein
VAGVKLHVCYGTFPTPRPGGHPCRNAYQALKDAGHDPEVKRVYGAAFGPLKEMPGRKRVREMTGQSWVPVLELEDTTIAGSDRIVEWAQANPRA